MDKELEEKLDEQRKATPYLQEYYKYIDPTFLPPVQRITVAPSGYIGKLFPKEKVPTPLEQQEGGTHYKNFKIQPAEYNHANNIPFLEGNIIKYVTRWRQKDGIKDLKKARHCIDILLELENGNDISRP